MQSKMKSGKVNSPRRIVLLQRHKELVKMQTDYLSNIFQQKTVQQNNDTATDLEKADTMHEDQRSRIIQEYRRKLEKVLRQIQGEK